MICPVHEEPVEEGGTMTTTVEAPVEPQAPEVAEAEEPTRITQVEDLPDPIRADIIARRQAGETLAELKTHFAHIDPAIIREVLPPANKREAKQREAKAKVSETQQGVGGRSGKAKSDPKPKAEQEPKPDPKPRYIEDQDLLVNLSERALACRQVVGRGKLAELLDTTGSAVWRFEQGRIHPDEVTALQTGLAAIEKRIAEGEFVKPEKAPAAKQASKADLTHRIEVTVELVKAARGDKGITKAALVDSVLAVLDPS
jgi:hypothetical protein